MRGTCVTADSMSPPLLAHLLQVMVSAGSLCVFHVGGGVDEVVDPRLPEIPRWEFFVGDRCVRRGPDAADRIEHARQMMIKWVHGPGVAALCA